MGIVPRVLEGLILSNNTNNKKHRNTIINRVLVIFIVICFIVLIYNLSYREPVDNFKPKFPTEGIINIHEHIHRSSDAEKWLLAMDECGVSATVMMGSPKETFLLKGTYLFDINQSYKQYLIEGKISDTLKSVFKDNGLFLSSNAIISIKDERTWVIIDEPKVYNVFDNNTGLQIYNYSPFNDYSENNDVILYLEKKHDSKILAFPTIDPRDPDKLEMLKDELRSGAVGLKLYSGHTGDIFPEPKTTLYDYLGPLDRIDMDGVYDHCERNQVPIIWHIKLKWDYLFNETKNVLSKFPNLIVNIPHFGVLGSNLSRLGELMDEFSGVYTDVSFGGFAYWSMQLASNHIDEYRNFVNKYHDRVMFGTDMVVTNNIRKTVPWMASLIMGYRDMLEKRLFHINITNITGEGFDFNGTLNGFDLSKQILDEIYFENPLKFLEGKPANERETKSRASSSRSSNSSYEFGYNSLEVYWVKIEILHWNRIIIATNENSIIFNPKLN